MCRKLSALWVHLEHLECSLQPSPPGCFTKKLSEVTGSLMRTQPTFYFLRVSLSASSLRDVGQTASNKVSYLGGTQGAERQLGVGTWYRLPSP